MEDKLKRELQHLDGVKADWNVIMAEHTSLRVGGPVFCLLRPLDLAGLQTAVQVLKFSFQFIFHDLLSSRADQISGSPIP